MTTTFPVQMMLSRWWDCRSRSISSNRRVVGCSLEVGCCQVVDGKSHRRRVMAFALPTRIVAAWSTSVMVCRFTLVLPTALWLRAELAVSHGMIFTSRVQCKTGVMGVSHNKLRGGREAEERHEYAASKIMLESGCGLRHRRNNAWNVERVEYCCHQTSWFVPWRKGNWPTCAMMWTEPVP